MPPKPATAVPIEPLGDGESGKLVRLGIARDDSLMYYISKGDVWATGRKVPGQPARPAFIVARLGLAMDYERYLYYLDGDGDVSRKSRVG